MKALGCGAFGECGNLAAVEGGAGVEDVGSCVFDGTPFFERQTGLVRFGNWVVGYNGDWPTALVIPDGVTGALLNLNADVIKDLTLPASLRSGSISFRGDKVRVPSLDGWIHRTFSLSCYGGDYEGYDLYAAGRIVRAVTIPGSMRKVPGDLFRRCRSIQSVTFGAGIEQIGSKAFNSCGELRQATFPSSLRAVGWATFGGCTNLVFTLPSQLDEIDRSAFAGTSSYKQAVATAKEKGEVAYLGNWAIGWPYIWDDDEEDVPCPESVVIREGTRGIMEDAFYGWASLKQVTLPKSLKVVGAWAFEDTALKRVALPDGLKRIDKKAFYSPALSALPKLPASLEGVGKDAFGRFGDSDDEEDDLLTPTWYAKAANGWIVAGGWLLGYKNANYVWDEEAGKWREDEANPPPAPPRTLTVPATVKHIAGFTWPEGDEEEAEEPQHELILPNRLETISADAFCGLWTGALTIPASVKRIGGGAFCYVDGPVAFLGRPPTLDVAEDGDVPFEDASIGYFAAGTPGWTDGMTYAGLTMEARMLVGGKLVPGVSIALDIVGEGTATGCEKEVYAAGTKLNLRAKPAAGFYFAGWEVDGQTVSTSASFPYTVPDVEDGVRLTARFVFDAIDFEPVDDVACDAGEEIEVPIFCMSGTPMTYKIANLPKGVKLDEKSMTISGTPTVPGVYTVALTATNKNKNVATLTFRISVANFRADWFDVDEVLGFVPGVAIEPISLDGCGLDFENGETLSVAGLPRGLSYDAKAHEVKGRPTQPGTYTVTFTGKVKLLDERGRTVTVTDIATATWTVWPLPTLTLTPRLRVGRGRRNGARRRRLPGRHEGDAEGRRSEGVRFRRLGGPRRRARRRHRPAFPDAALHDGRRGRGGLRAFRLPLGRRGVPRYHGGGSEGGGSRLRRRRRAGTPGSLGRDRLRRHDDDAADRGRLALAAVRVGERPSARPPLQSEDVRNHRRPHPRGCLHGDNPGLQRWRRKVIRAGRLRCPPPPELGGGDVHGRAVHLPRGLRG